MLFYEFIQNFKNDSWSIANRMNKLMIDTENNTIFSLRLGGKKIEAATRNLIGFAKCLLAMKQEILRNESSHTHESFNQDAGRGFEPDSTK